MSEIWDLFSAGVDRLEKAAMACEEVREMGEHGLGLGLICANVVDDAVSIGFECQGLVADTLKGRPPGKLDLALAIGRRFL